MYSQKKSVTFSNKVKVKPFCKVCHDSGKTEAEYTSHFVKSEPGFKGKVVCPTLLSQSCTYCNVTGHTVSYCETLKLHNKNKEKSQRASAFQKDQAPVVTKKLIKKRGFAALGDLEEANDQVEAQVEAYQVSYPSIGQAQAQAQAQQAPVISYASMTAKAPTQVKPTVKTQVIKKQAITKKSWADWSDSDDDEDDEEEVSSDCECDYCDF